MHSEIPKVCIRRQKKGLSEYWQQVEQRDWITFKTGTTQSELKGEKAYWANSPTNRNLPNLIRNLLLAISVFSKKRPALTISTGAGVAVPFLVAAKYLCRSQVVFIESKTLHIVTGKQIGRAHV